MDGRTPVKPVPGLNDYDIKMNCFEMGCVLVAVMEKQRDRPDLERAFARFIKQLDEIYTLSKYGPDK